MREELLAYYERELAFLRQMGGEFAEQYPRIAGRLGLEPHRCEDPHVERLIEAFALLAARVHLKVDDDFPEITQALLDLIYPHFTRPIPALSVVEFQLDPERGKGAAGVTIPRNSLLYSRPVDGLPCKFRTCYDTTLWPLRVREAQWLTPERIAAPWKVPEAVAVLRIALECFPGASLAKLPLEFLRFYLDGEPQLVNGLYELLCGKCLGAWAWEAGRASGPVALGELRPVGFADEEAVLDYSRRSFAGYRLLQEYFAFPEKFFFVDLTGLAPLAAFDARVELLLPFARFERQERDLSVTSRTIRLGCSPVINLFPQTAEPILLEGTKTEYPIVPDLRRPHALEVFSVDEVVRGNPQSAEVLPYDALFSFRHGASDARPRAYWYARRRSAGRKGDGGTDMWISLVDLAMRPAPPAGDGAVDSLTVRCTCTNRDLPSRLTLGDASGDFEVEGFPLVRRVTSLRNPPTASLRLPLGQGTLWRLISQLSLNYLSLTEEGRDGLQEILRLYNFSESPHWERQIQGITRVASRPHLARLIAEEGVAFARGLRVELELDENQFVGGGVYLFACVLERFLGLFVSINSFVQCSVRTVQRKEALTEWPPRAGHRLLI